MRADTRSCTMVSMARCLNQTLVQQSQEEAEWFQFCRPAVETKKEGKGKSVIEKGTESSDSTYVDRSFTGCIHLQENEVEYEYECLLFDAESFNVCYGLKQVEW